MDEATNEKVTDEEEVSEKIDFAGAIKMMDKIFFMGENIRRKKVLYNMNLTNCSKKLNQT